MKITVMPELIRTFRLCTPPDKLAKLLREHSPIASHCPACRTVWPCTLWIAASAASAPPKTTPAA